VLVLREAGPKGTTSYAEQRAGGNRHKGDRTMNHERFEGLSRTLAGASSRRQALKLFGGGVAGGLVLAAGRKGAAAQTATNPLVGIPIVGPAIGGTFTGTLDIVRFAIRRGQLVAVGELTGVVRDAAGNIVRTITDQLVELPVLGTTSGTCQILNLDLGPLDLNLLGLRVQLSRIVLNITAIPGGGLLGDLLCAIANLLDGNGRALGRLRNLLNDLLAALG
jgi:hypothetical protein